MKIAGFTSISDDNKRQLGLFIKIERESQGLSQKELINDANQRADLFCINPSSDRNWTNYKR